MTASSSSQALAQVSAASASVVRRLGAGLQLSKEAQYTLNPPNNPWNGQRGALQLRCFEVAWPNLPGGFQGKRLLHLSDLHMAPHSQPWLHTTLPLIQHLQPDALLLTGDFITHGPKALPALAAWLKALPASILKLACPGNHDSWDGQGGEALAQVMSDCGVHYLRESLYAWRLEDKPNSEPFYLAGLSDFTRGLARPLKLTQAMSERGIEQALLLCHNPAQLEWPDLTPWERFPLVLSGHTHGGQFWMPHWLGQQVAEADYLSGVFELGPKTTLYVNRGVGTASVLTKKYLPKAWEALHWDIPLPRWGVKPEMTLFTLRTA